jgi:hypothetical protein
VTSLVDDNGVSSFVDDLGVFSWVDDGGQTIGPDSMALNFPDAPTVGLVFDRWVWDSVKWVLSADFAPPVSQSGVSTITGTPTEGQILTSQTGTWTGTAPITFSRQWKRGGVNVGTNSATYTLLATDVGGNMTCIVTGTNSAGTGVAPSNTLGPVAAAPAAPVNTVLPALSGIPIDTNALSTTSGTWTGTPAPSFTYQWKRGAGVGTNIPGATGITYTLTGSDIGLVVKCTVTATNASGSASATSADSAVITANVVAPVNTVLPVIDDTTPTENQTLNTNNGSWTGAPTPTFTYKWKRGAAYIPGATAIAYAVVTADVGSTIASEVTATNTGGTATATSVNTAVVVAAATAPLAPSIDLTATSDTGLSAVDNITSDNTPSFDVICATVPLAGDIIEISKDGAVASSVTLTTGDISGSTVPGLGLSTIASGTYAFTAKHGRGGLLSAASAAVNVTIDTVIPVLTSATGIQNVTTQYNANLTVTTDTGQGTIYFVVLPAAGAAPTPIQIINGMDAAGLFVPAGNNGSLAVSSTGSKSLTATGISTTGSYRAHYTQQDTAGNNAVTTTTAPWTQTISSFTPFGVGGFDGSTMNYVGTITPASSIAAGKQGLVSVWLKVLGGSGVQRYIFTIASGATIKLWIFINASNAIQVQGRQATGSSDIMVFQSVAAGSPLIPPSAWVHCAMAWDLGAGVEQIYINGVSNKSGSQTLTNDNLGYNQTTASVGSSVTSSLKYNGSMSELYVNLHETLDLSVAANLQKFRANDGTPVFLGATGTLPTGSQPEYYLGGDDDFTAWGTNNGSKGFVTLQGGTPTSVVGPP